MFPVVPVRPGGSPAAGRSSGCGPRGGKQPAILHRVDPDRAVELGPVAGALPRVIADPAVDGRHRVVGGQPPPGPLMLASTGQPGLDVLPGQAASVTRREQVPVDGPARPHRAGQCSIMERVRQRREITWRMAHRRTSAIGLRASVRLRARDGLGKKVPYRHARQAASCQVVCLPVDVPGRSSGGRSHGHQPVPGEDRVAGGYDRPVDRIAWAVAGPERLEHDHWQPSIRRSNNPGRFVTIGDL